MELDPQAILDRVMEAYATCVGYRDEGTVMSIVHRPEPRVVRGRFSTRFVRGRGFLIRAEQQLNEQPPSRFAFWVNAKGESTNDWSTTPARVWSDRRLPPWKDPSALEVHMFAGMMTAGASGFVPPWLMPELNSAPYPTRPREARPETDTDGAPTGRVVLTVLDSSRTRQEWTVDPASGLVHRIHLPRPTPDDLAMARAWLMTQLASAFGAESAEARLRDPEMKPTEGEATIEYAPAFVDDLDESELVFTPPET
ncbi:MAG: hypothetical protein AB7Q00_12955 [Phycisphaerales bacterium]